MRNDEVARAFANHEKAQAGNLYTDGEVIYSYGSHFPIAVHLPDGSILWNEDTYGVTTSKHQGEVAWALHGNKRVYATTQELKDYIYTKPSVVVLERRKPPSDLSDIVSDIYAMGDKLGVDNISRRGLGSTINAEVEFLRLKDAIKHERYIRLGTYSLGKRFSEALGLILNRRTPNMFLEENINYIASSCNMKQLKRVFKRVQEINPGIIGLAAERRGGNNGDVLFAIQEDDGSYILKVKESYSDRMRFLELDRALHYLDGNLYRAIFPQGLKDAIRIACTLDTL